MKNLPIDWDSVPDVMNKDQFYRLCHISKSTALHLLKSGKVPCEWSGKKTRCYKIRKEDVKAYLEERAIFPELYSAPKMMFGRTLRSEPFTPSSIPHQEDGMAIIMWQSFPKNCPRMYLGKCTAITPNCSANIRMS